MAAILALSLRIVELSTIAKTVTVYIIYQGKFNETALLLKDINMQEINKLLLNHYSVFIMHAYSDPVTWYGSKK